jgi:hypothetical protein
MLSVLLKMHNQKFGSDMIDLLVDIESNNYYGLKKLENDLKEYWHNLAHISHYSCNGTRYCDSER